MSTESRREHWQSVYQAKPSTTVSWYQSQASMSLELVQTLLADHDQAVIDVGGGASTFVDGMLAANYTDVSVLDISSAALEVARTRLGDDASRVHWIVADILTWVPERRFNVWHDRAVLHFLTAPRDQARYAALLAETVMSGGHAVIGTFAPNGPSACSGLAVQQFDPVAVARLVGADFVVVNSRDEDHVTPTGAVQAFSWTVLRRC
jgi:SAM-dependent methyltransferase